MFDDGQSVSFDDMERQQQPAPRACLLPFSVKRGERLGYPHRPQPISAKQGLGRGKKGSFILGANPLLPMDTSY